MVPPTIKMGLPILNDPIKIVPPAFLLGLVRWTLLASCFSWVRALLVELISPVIFFWSHFIHASFGVMFSRALHPVLSLNTVTFKRLTSALVCIKAALEQACLLHLLSATTLSDTILLFGFAEVWNFMCLDIDCQQKL